MPGGNLDIPLDDDTGISRDPGAGGDSVFRPRPDTNQGLNPEIGETHLDDDIIDIEIIFPDIPIIGGPGGPNMPPPPETIGEPDGGYEGNNGEPMIPTGQPDGSCTLPAAVENEQLEQEAEIKGAFFYAADDEFTKFYSVCLLASTELATTQLIEGGMIEQVYSMMSQLQIKFDSGLPGASLKEISLSDMTNKQKNALVKSNLFQPPASVMSANNNQTTQVSSRRGPTQAYEFRTRFGFNITPGCEHLTLFAFLKFDQVKFSETYGLDLDGYDKALYHGPIKQLAVILNSSLRTNGNIRSDQTVNNLIASCSTSINEAIQF
jgi:hypothetical protein